jgi:two-component system, LytTR family, sensor kinase
MTMHEFIFSNKRRTKISRHLLFWSCWLLYMICTQVRNQSPEVIGMKNFIVYQVATSLNRLILQMVFCGIAVYFLVPRYLQKKKYGQFIILFVLFLFCMYWLTYFEFVYVWYRSYVWISEALPLPYTPNVVKPLSIFLDKYYSFYSNIHFTGSFVSSGFILLVKYYKSWYKKQRENEMLINENAQAELQLLKAQVHPHFLFNTLNNIYALTLDDSPMAATTVQKLSGMVFYMINEGAESFVPVSKEIKMLLDYIGLEKIRYGDRLEMIVDIKQNSANDMLIAPLLMIPFVENCFKHGASKIIDEAYINIFIETGNEWLEFKISNNRPVGYEAPDERKRIGLMNVKKRLQLLYPAKHQLDIQSSGKLFSVYMKVKLEKQKAQPEQIISPHKIVSYAH